MNNTQTEDKTYNGWTNYETWNVALWMDNDRGSQEYWSQRALNRLAISRKDEFFTKEEKANKAIDLGHKAIAKAEGGA